jgi:hypothetical protein
VHDIFQSFFDTPKTSKLFKAVLRAINKRDPKAEAGKAKG